MYKKLKKYLFFPTFMVSIFYLIAILIISPILVELLENFPAIKFNNERVVSYYNLKALNPKELDFKTYEEVFFKSSITPNINLSGWFIPSDEKSESCFLLVHGWRANRQTTLPFAEILKRNNYNIKNNIFMVDLRNSGLSSSSLSDLGYKTSYDLYDAIIYLNKYHGIKKFNIFAISMGAMATMNMLHHKEAELNKRGIIINKIILDSPLMNAREAIKHYKVPTVFRNNLVYFPYFFIINSRWNNSLDKLKFSNLSKNVELSKILIIQSREDKTTTFDVMSRELKKINSNNLNLNILSNGSHGVLFKNSKYESIVLSFLDSNL